eukprot:764880-Hanusia_phi.AAC.3
MELVQNFDSSLHLFSLLLQESFEHARLFQNAGDAQGSRQMLHTSGPDVKQGAMAGGRCLLSGEGEEADHEGMFAVADALVQSEGKRQASARTPLLSQPP